MKTNVFLLEMMKEIRARNNVNWVRFLELIADQEEAGLIMKRIEKCEEQIATEVGKLLRWGRVRSKDKDGGGGKSASMNELRCLDRIEHWRDQNNAAWMDGIRSAFMANPTEARATMKAIAKGDDKIRALRKSLKGGKENEY